MSTPAMRNLAILILSVLAVTGSTFAGNIDLAWDPVPGATGYRAYYGANSGQYTTGSQDMGNSLSGSLIVPDCGNYYVAVKAYNGQSVSADFSNEVAGWAHPVITSYTPSQVAQGAQPTMYLDGANFAPGMNLTAEIEGAFTGICQSGGTPSATFCLQDGDCPGSETCQLNSGELIRVSGVSVTSCNEARADLTVEPSSAGARAALIGDFFIRFEAVNPDSGFAERTDTLSVTFDEFRMDLNRDVASTRDRIDGLDLSMFSRQMGMRYNIEPGFDPDADFDGNGIVDGDDLGFFGSRFGMCWNGSSWSNGACN